MRAFLRMLGALSLLVLLLGLFSCSCSSRRGYYVGQVAGQPVNIHFCDVSRPYNCKPCDSCAPCPACVSCEPCCYYCPTPTIIYHRVGNCYAEGCSLLPEPLLFYEPLPFGQASGGGR